MDSEALETGGSGKDIGYYLSLLWRWKVTIISLFIVGTVGAVTAALMLPKTYISSSTIIVEEPEVPPELIGTTVTTFAERRLELITQRIMTTQRLVEFINKFDLYPEYRDKEPITETAERLRANIRLEKMNATIVDPRNGRRINALTSFRLVVEDRSPEKAQLVAAELTELYLDINTRERTEQTTQVAAFLTSETERLADRISELEAQITAFKQENPDYVPGQSTAILLDIIGRSETQVRDLDERLLALESRKFEIEREINALAVPQNTDGQPQNNTLPELMRQYAAITKIYGPEHPDVVRLRSMIEGTQAQQSGESNWPDGPVALGGDDTPAIDPSVFKTATDSLKRQIRTIDQRSAELRSEKRELETRLAELEDTALAAPELDQKYLELQRDYENAKAQYDSTKQKQLVAEQASVLEQSKKSERFTLLEPPLVATSPTETKRKLIIAGGIGVSLLLGMGIAFLFDLFDDRIHTAKQLQAVVGVPPLMLMPTLAKPKSRRGIMGLIRRWRERDE